jgi:hypothetical protein
MSKLTSILALAGLCTGLAAQWAPRTTTTITVAEPTGYAVKAVSGSTTKSAGIADQTKITRGTSIAAMADRYAMARSYLSPTYSWSSGSGASFSEFGSIYKDSSGKGGGTAGTAKGSATSAAYGNHSASVHFDVKENTEGTIKIVFHGSHRDGSKSDVSVDIDGDSKADFTAATSAGRGTSSSKSFAVKAGKNGITVLVTTEGSASLPSSSRHSSYHASTSVYFRPKAGGGTTCSGTAYGAECGGKLAFLGSSSWFGMRTVTLELTNAAASSAGFLVIGVNKASVPLPGSSCKLLTDVKLFLPFRTDTNGKTRHIMRAPSSTKGALTCQDVILDFSKGLKITSSNGMEVICK